MEMIKIDIEDVENYTKSAYILDQPDLLKDIEALRKSWKLSNGLIPYKSLKKWLKEPHSDFSLSKGAARLYLQAQEKLKLDKLHGNLDKFEHTRKTRKFAYMDPLDYEMEHLLKKHGFPASFKKTILRAIVCGKVREADLTEGGEFEYEEFLNNLKVGTTAKKVYKGDIKHKIKRDREWYWLWLEEKSKGKGAYGRIMQKWEKRHPPGHEEYLTDQNLVEQAVSRYRRFLKR